MDSSSVSDRKNESGSADSCHDLECYDDDLPIVRVMGVQPYQYELLAQEKQPRKLSC